MDKEQFISHIRQADIEGLTLETSSKRNIHIISCNKDRLHYHRGKSTISLKYSHLFKTWKAFKGSAISCQQLKTWKPAVFDSRAHPKAGHDSNCGLFVLLMQHLGLAQNVGCEGNLYTAELLEQIQPAVVPSS